MTTIRPASMLLPIAMLLVAIVCFQCGAALAKQLFPAVGAAGAVALRLGLASVIMLIVWRPWRRLPGARELKIILYYGLSMGLMNFFFYASIARIPLGISVALEFTGPLGVAMAASRRAVDFLWIALAVIGLGALLPLADRTQALDVLGIVYGFAAAICWALYIVFGQRTTNGQGGQTVALGTVIAALVTVPLGVVQAGAALFALKLLPLACGVAVLSSALPYTLEMYALTRVPARTFGILMSLDPVFAALSGLVFLSESLSAIQWAGIASIMCASAGSAATSPPRAPSVQPLPE